MPALLERVLDPDNFCAVWAVPARKDKNHG
jgi:hypothetical protein